MKRLRLLTFSDVHLGIRKLNADVMCGNLAAFIFPLLDEVDMVCIVGDLFDTAISFHDECGPAIIAFITRFMRLCDEKNITLRVLRGTFSHDRTQPRLLEALHTKYKLHNNFGYFDKVSLEYIEQFDMRVLYIPDDAPFKTSSELMDHVHELLNTLGWDYVDYAFVHGYFDFVLPKTEKMDKKMVFTEEMFSFVKRRIIVGHVHTPAVSQSGMIYYNGSTDRLAQGEEEAKGMLLTEDDGDKHITTTFLKNKKATIFKTLDYTDTSDDEVFLVKQFETDLQKLPQDGRSLYVRFIHPSPFIRAAIASFVTKHYPCVIFSDRSRKKAASDKDDKEKDTVLAQVDMLPSPTPSDLPELVLQQLLDSGRKTYLTTDLVSEMLEQLG